MTTFSCTYQEFYNSAGEFFKLAEYATSLEEVENGAKAIGLMYLGINQMSHLEQHQADIILCLVNRTLEDFDPDPIVVRGLAAMKFLKEFVS